MYINDLHINSTDGKAVPAILNETLATAWVDGLNGLGAVVGNFCMDLAVEKAKVTGVGVVCAKSEFVLKNSLIFFKNMVFFRIKSLWNCGLVHNACDGKRFYWNLCYEYFAFDVSNTINGSGSGNKSSFICGTS
jgi:Malate/L-lactate dehydrogenase